MSNDILVKVGADISDFSRKLKQSQKEMADFGKGQADALNEAAKAAGVYADANGRLREANGRFVSDTRKAELGLQDFGNSADTVFGKITNASKEFKQVGAAITGAGTVIATGLGVAAKQAIDFESSFAGVRKTVDASEAEFAALERGIRDMSKELPATASEIAGVAEVAGQLGIKQKDILQFTRVMVDLGESTNMSSEMAATSLARLANITKMPMENIDRLGATIVGLGNNLATTESEITEMAMRIAGAGSQVGLTEAQILSFSGALSSVGIEAEAGGSAFSRVMIEMANATATGGKDLENFAKVAGMSSEEFKKAYEKDAAGAILTFIEGLDRMSSSGENVFGILEDLGLSEIRVRDALLRASGAGDLFRESLELGSKAWEDNTALTNEAEQRYKTVASQFAILKNTATDFAISIGQALLPAVRLVTSVLKSLIEQFNGMSDGMKSFIAISAAAGAGLMLITGPMLILIGFLPNILEGFKVVKTVILGVRTAMLALNAAFLANPAVFIIAAIVTAVIGLAIVVYKYWEPISEFFATLWEGIKIAGLAIWEALKVAWAATVEWLKGVWEPMSGFFEGLWSAVVLIFTTFKETVTTVLSTLWETVKTLFAAAFLTVIYLVSGNWNKIGEVWTKAGAKIVGLVTSMFSKVKQLWTDGVAKLITKWLELRDKTIQKAGEIIAAVVKYFSELPGKVGEKLAELAGKISKKWEEIKADAAQMGVDMIRGLINGITSMGTKVAEKVTEVVGGAVNAAKKFLGIASPSKVLAQIGRWTGEGLANGIDGTRSLVAKASNALAEAAVPTTGQISMSYATPDGSYASLAQAVNGTVDVDTRNDSLVDEIRNLRREMTNLRVEVNEREFGRLVSDTTTDARNQANRGRGHRRI